MRVTSEQIRQFIYAVGDGIVDDHIEHIELYKADGTPLDFTADPTRMRWEGEWVNTVPYAKNDVVNHGGDLYILMAEEIAAGEDPPDANDDWEILSLGGSGGGGGGGGTVRYIFAPPGADTVINTGTWKMLPIGNPIDASPGDFVRNADGTITVKVAGIFTFATSIGATVAMSHAATIDFRFVRAANDVVPDQTPYVAMDRDDHAAGDYPTKTLAVTIRCAVNDRLGIIVFQGAAANNTFAVTRFGGVMSGDSSVPTFVNALPPTPYDGQEIYFQTAAMAAEGVVWHFRYRAGSAHAKKWEFLGGGDWIVGPSGDTTSAVAADVPLAGGPSITLPLGGDYKAEIACQLISLIASSGYKLAYLFKDNVNTAITLASVADGANDILMAGTPGRFSADAGQVMTIKVNSANAKNNRYVNGTIGLRPIRVG